MDFLSWASALTTLVSVWMIGNKQPAGHLVGLCGSLGWIGASWGSQWALVALNIVFVVLYVRNYALWRAPKI